ncbi:MAG: DNA repair protein RecO [Firmicutes bacterium]|nr:DNA repair protein RecO [Bacillota bacterium]
MRTETEGIVLRRQKISEKTQMITLFTRDFGKISAGTNLSEGRNRNQPALHAFTYGRYELNKSRENYFINKAETVKSYYSLAEDPDLFFHASYALEFTNKVLEEGVPEQGVYGALADFLLMVEKRRKGIGTLVLAYQAKVISYMGHAPVLDECAICGRKKEPHKFSVGDGGVICRDCYEETYVNPVKTTEDSLIYDLKFDIVNVLKYFMSNPMRNLERIALREDTGKELQRMIRAYAAYYLEASDLKSEELI